MKKIKSDIYKNPNKYIKNFDNIPDKEKESAISKRLKQISEDMSADYRSRIKALNDPGIRNSKLYKEFENLTFEEFVDKLSKDFKLSESDIYDIFEEAKHYDENIDENPKLMSCYDGRIDH